MSRFIAVTFASFFIACWSVTAVQHAAAAIIIDNYSAATNDRFTNSPSFIAAPYDYSGVGQDASGRWGTLISPNVIITADHLPSAGTISFYANNDPSLTPIVRTLTGSQLRIGTSDLRLIQLDSAVPTGIAVYSIARTPLVGVPSSPAGIVVNNAGPLQNDFAFITGYSPTPSAIDRAQAVGTNLVSGYAQAVPFAGGFTDTLIFNRDTPSSPDYLFHEAQVDFGDSGAPAFFVENGQLQLFGVNSFKLQSSGADVGTGVTYTGNYTAQIDAFLTVTAVPEPPAIWLLTLLVSLAIGMRAMVRPVYAFASVLLG